MAERAHLCKGTTMPLHGASNHDTSCHRTPWHGTTNMPLHGAPRPPQQPSVLVVRPHRIPLSSPVLAAILAAIITMNNRWGKNMHADKNFSTICQRKETHMQQSKSSRVLPIPPKQYPMMTILSGSAHPAAMAAVMPALIRLREEIGMRRMNVMKIVEAQVFAQTWIKTSIQNKSKNTCNAASWLSSYCLKRGTLSGYLSMRAERWVRFLKSMPSTVPP